MSPGFAVRALDVCMRAALTLGTVCCSAAAEQSLRASGEGQTRGAATPLRQEGPGTTGERPPGLVRALVRGTFCWDLPSPPPRDAPEEDAGTWHAPSPVAGAVLRGSDGSTVWRVGGVAVPMQGGAGGRLAHGGFTLRGSRLTKDGPWWAHFARAINTQIDVDLAACPPAYTSPFTEPRNFENYTAGSAYVRDPEHLDMSLVGRETIDGVDCEVYRARPEDPVKVEEPHVVHEYRIWVDAARGVQMRADGLNAEGTPVRMLRCSDFVQRQDGAWAPLTVTRRVLPGKTRGESQWSGIVAHSNGKKEFDEALAFDVEFDGYEQVTKYGVFADDLILPASVIRYKGNGDPIMQLRFEHYEIDDLP